MAIRTKRSERQRFPIAVHHIVEFGAIGVRIAPSFHRRGSPELCRASDANPSRCVFPQVPVPTIFSFSPACRELEILGCFSVLPYNGFEFAQLGTTVQPAAKDTGACLFVEPSH